MSVEAGDEAAEVVLARPPAARRAHQVPARQLADDDAALDELRDELRRDRPAGGTRRASSGRAASRPRRARRAARGSAPPSRPRARSATPDACRARRRGRRAPGRRSSRRRSARAPSFGVNAPDGSYAVCAEVARARDAQPLRVADVERAGRVRAAQPLLRGDGVEVERAGVDRDRAGRLRAVDEQRQPARAPRSCARSSRRPVVQSTCESAISCVRGVTAARIASSSASRDDDARAGRVQRPDQAEVLLVGRDDLVLGAEAEPGEHDRAAARRRVGERDVLGSTPSTAASPRARLSRSSSISLEVRPCRSGPRSDRARACAVIASTVARASGPVRARVEVRVALEHGELRACLLERHPTVELHRCVVGEEPAVDAAPLLRPRRRLGGGQAAHEDVVDPGPGAEKPHAPRLHRARARGGTLESPQRTTGSSGRRARRRTRPPGAAPRREAVAAKLVAWRLPTTPCRRRQRDTDAGRSAAPSPRRARERVEPEPARLRAPERRGFSTSVRPRGRAPRRARIAFAWPVKAERRSPWLRSVSARPSAAVDGSGPSAARARRRRRRSSRSSAPRCRAPRAAPPGGRATSGRRRSRAAPSPRGTRAARAGRRCRGRGSSVRTSSGTGVAYGAMRVVLADPPAFTPPYDHELAAALARAGAEVELVTSRFRFGEAPAPDGLRAARALLSRSRRGCLRPLAAAAAAEGRRSIRSGSRRCGAQPRRRAPPPVARRAGARRAPASGRTCPAVFTAHDLLPRRTAAAAGSLAPAASRASTASSCTASSGRDTLAALGVDPARLRVIPHPVFPSDPERRDDGRTVLCFGVIRPYKGLGDAIEAVRRARRRAAARRGRSARADRAVPRAPRRARRRVAARLPAAGRGRPRLRRGDGRRLPVPAGARPERRAAARARRRACRRSRTTSAAIAEPVRALRRRAASCRRATSTALAAAVRELLGDRDALEAGPRRRAPRARGADLGRGGARASRALRGDRVIFRAPLRRRDRAPARRLRRGRGGAARGVPRRRAAYDARRPRRGRGGVRRLRRRRRDRDGGARRHARPLRAARSTRTPARSTRRRSTAPCSKRWPPFGLEIENR